MLKIQQIYEAKNRIDRYIKNTPFIRDDYFSDTLGRDVFLKLENLQITHAFKIRGSANVLLQLDKEQKKRGLITASTGNHGQGVAYMANKLGIDATVFVPTNAPQKKIDAIKKYGAKVQLFGESYFEASNYAHEKSEQMGKLYVHSFDDERFFAGNATIFLEMLAVVPDLDVIFAPIGGGGLAVGLSYAAKKIQPNIKIFGIESRGAPSMFKSLAKDNPVTLKKVETIADGIAVKRPSDLSFSYIKKFIDDVLLVSDDDIKRTIFNLHEKSNLVVEGAGAAALAGLVKFRKKIKGQRIGVVISGGNIDPSLLLNILRQYQKESK